MPRYESYERPAPREERAEPREAPPAERPEPRETRPSSQNETSDEER